MERKDLISIHNDMGKGNFEYGKERIILLDKCGLRVFNKCNFFVDSIERVRVWTRQLDAFATGFIDAAECLIRWPTEAGDFRRA